MQVAVVHDLENDVGSVRAVAEIAGLVDHEDVRRVSPAVSLVAAGASRPVRRALRTDTLR